MKKKITVMRNLLEEDTKMYHNLTFDERAKILKMACASATKIARSRADSEEIFRYQQSPALSLEPIWSRLRCGEDGKRTS
jgi:hypothetical protein